MKVEINVEKTLEAIDIKLNELDVVMNILYKHLIPTVRNCILRRRCGFPQMTRPTSKFHKPSWAVKRRFRSLLGKRLSYERACVLSRKRVEGSDYGTAFSYLVDLEDRIKKVSREFPNQPILLDELDLDFIFLNMTKKGLDNYIENYVRSYIEDMRRPMRTGIK